MLYINSISNQKASKGRKFAICHEKIPGMPNIPELTPSPELLEAYRSNRINFEEFEQRFKQQMRAEYRKPQNRLKGLAEYSIEEDVTLHSRDEKSEGSSRSILAEIINGIWCSMGVEPAIIDLTVSQEMEVPEVEVESDEIETESEISEEIKPEDERSDITQIRDIAEECEFFSPQNSDDKRVSCIICNYYDSNIHACNKRNILLIDYHWE